MTPAQSIAANKWARRIAVWLWFLINALNLWLGFTARLPQVVISLVFVASFIPYLVYVRYISRHLAVNDVADDKVEP